jgi:hypothetical protein
VRLVSGIVNGSLGRDADPTAEGEKVVWWLAQPPSVVEKIAADRLDEPVTDEALEP